MTPKEYTALRHEQLKEASLGALKAYAKMLGVILPPPGRVRALITAIIKKEIAQQVAKQKKEKALSTASTGTHEPVREFRTTETEIKK